MDKNSEAIMQAKREINKEIFPNATIRDFVDELTLREGEEGTAALLPTAPPMWGTVDGGRHSWTRTGIAICQAIHKGVG